MSFCAGTALRECGARIDATLRTGIREKYLAIDYSAKWQSNVDPFQVDSKD